MALNDKTRTRKTYSFFRSEPVPITLNVTTIISGGSDVTFGSTTQIPFVNNAQDDFAYTASFTYNTASRVLTLGGEDAFIAMGSAPPSNLTPGLGLSPGNRITWQALAGNADLAGIDAREYLSRDTISFGGGVGGAFNGFGITQFSCGTDGVGGGQFEWWLNVSRIITYDHNNNFDFLSISTPGIVFKRSGQTCFSLENPAGTETNVSLFGAGVTWNSADRVIHLSNCIQSPLAPPSDGGYFYSSQGVLHWSGSSGGVTAIDSGVLLQSASLTGATNTGSISHGGKMLSISHSSTSTYVVPSNASVAFPVGTPISFYQSNTGQVVVSGASGVTINSAETLKLRKQYSNGTLIKTAPNVWLLTGDIERA